MPRQQNNSMLEELQKELSNGPLSDAIERCSTLINELINGLPIITGSLKQRIEEARPGEVDKMPGYLVSRGAIKDKNKSSPHLVAAGALYVRPTIPINHRFHGKDSEEVKKLFQGQLKLIPGAADTTRKDTAGLCANVWEKLGIDMTEKSFLSDILWEFSDSRLPVNSKLKALNKVFNAHKEPLETKFQGILDKLVAKFNELNPADRPEGSNITFLSSTKIDALFGLVNTSGSKKSAPVAEMVENLEELIESLEKARGNLVLLGIKRNEAIEGAKDEDAAGNPEEDAEGEPDEDAMGESEEDAEGKPDEDVEGEADEDAEGDTDEDVVMGETWESEFINWQ